MQRLKLPFACLVVALALVPAALARRRLRARAQVAARRLHRRPYCQTGWYSSPAVADLDGDGQPDVIWGAYDVVALNGANGRAEVARRPTATACGRGWRWPT